MANYHGTLAAVRAFGRAGIRVTTADPGRFSVSAWSRFTSTRVQAPRVDDAELFFEWLMAFGAKNGRHVLLPTSDDTAWLYALYREQLSTQFYLESPPVDVVYRLLNKRLLYNDAVAAGLNVPRTWFPQNDQDLQRCGREARFPVLVKPLTQVMFEIHNKGSLVESSHELGHRYSWVARQPYGAKLLEFDPVASRPMVQEFYRDAATGIYNISAFVHAGRLYGARGARKLLQQPRRIGTGVCFEAAPVLPELAAGLERLVAGVGFSGVFEAEFINADQKPLLIDFNPRFYNQMAFDIARGLPLPLLAYHDARGDHGLLKRMCEALTYPEQSSDSVYVDLIALRLLLTAQGLSGAITRAEMEKWADWYKTHRDRCIYAVFDTHDKLPYWLAVTQLIARYSRHPRNFMRSIVFNRS